MALSSDGTQASLGTLIKFVDFPGLVTAHLDWCPDTPACEDLGAEIGAALLAGTATEEQLWDFIVAVCNWGGRTGNRVRGIVAKSYNPAVTYEKFAAAARERFVRHNAATLEPILRTGLYRAAQSIDDVVGFATSFATKMVRFMRRCSGGT